MHRFELASVGMLTVPPKLDDEESERLDTIKTYLELGGKLGIKPDPNLVSEMKGIRRAAYTRTAPEQFAPFNEIQQRHVVDYMNERRQVDSDEHFVDLILKADMPEGMIGKIRIYRTIFDRLDVVWFARANDDIADAALIGYFWKGAPTIGGPVVLERWSTMAEPPTFEQMQTIVRARQRMGKNIDHAVMGGLAIGAALGAVVFFVLYFLLDHPRGSVGMGIYLAVMFTGMGLGAFSGIGIRALKKRVLLSNLKTTHPEIVWAL